MAGRGRELIKRQATRVSVVAALGLAIAASAAPALAAPPSTVPGFAHYSAAQSQAGSPGTAHAGGDTGHRVH